MTDSITVFRPCKTTSGHVELHNCEHTDTVDFSCILHLISYCLQIFTLKRCK